jgi:hypothetical protein
MMLPLRPNGVPDLEQEALVFVGQVRRMMQKRHCQLVDGVAAEQPLLILQIPVEGCQHVIGGHLSQPTLNWLPHRVPANREPFRALWVTL